MSPFVIQNQQRFTISNSSKNLCIKLQTITVGTIIKKVKAEYLAFKFPQLLLNNRKQFNTVNTTLPYSYQKTSIANKKHLHKHSQNCQYCNKIRQQFILHVFQGTVHKTYLRKDIQRIHMAQHILKITCEMPLNTSAWLNNSTNIFLNVATIQFE